MGDIPVGIWGVSTESRVPEALVSPVVLLRGDWIWIVRDQLHQYMSTQPGLLMEDGTCSRVKGH